MLLAATGPVVDDDDPLTDQSPADVLWTRANSVESLPGVLTPLTWSLYGRLLELSSRQGFADLGVVPSAATGYPATVEDRLIGVFAGRCSINVGVIRTLMGGLPGVTGDDIERDMLGNARDGVTDATYRWRLPAVLMKAPARLAMAMRAPARCRRQTGAWWSVVVDSKGLCGPERPRAVLTEAITRFAAAARLQSATRLLYQSLVANVSQIATQAGNAELTGALLAGGDTGSGEETIVAEDLWRLAQGQLSLEVFVRCHGFHAQHGAEVQHPSWREDIEAIHRLLPKLRDVEPPGERRRRVCANHDRAVRSVLAALPREQRALARMVLHLAPRAGLALERCKASWLMIGDVVRASARAIGYELATAACIDDPGDTFHLFVEELLDPPLRDLSTRLARRRDAHVRYESIDLPLTWQGNPEPATSTPSSCRPRVSSLRGVGIGGGTAAGRVRVIFGAQSADAVEPGDILVCPTTDPSWVSVMAIAAGLVIDIGGAASHGAIVAREMGIPCVIGTHTGTADLRDGDLVMVDGTAGIVEILANGG